MPNNIINLISIFIYLTILFINKNIKETKKKTHTQRHIQVNITFLKLEMINERIYTLKYET